IRVVHNKKGEPGPGAVELGGKGQTTGEISALQKIAQLSNALPERLRLPLVELCLPALKQLSPLQQRNFKQCIHHFIYADKKVNLMEWALQRIVMHHLDEPRPIIRHHDLRALRNECQLLLSVLAYAGAGSDEAASEAFQHAAASLR